MPAKSDKIVLPMVTAIAMMNELRMNIPRSALNQTCLRLINNSVPGIRLGDNTAPLVWLALIRAKKIGKAIMAQAIIKMRCKIQLFFVLMSRNSHFCYQI